LIIHESPAVACADSILGQQDIAWPEREMLSTPGLEIQSAAERDDELAHRRGMPGELSSG
jgi:hypothetical protein